MAILLYSGFPLLLELLLQITFATAQEPIQQAVWNVPNGQDADFSNTFYDGNTVPISWNELEDGNTALYATLDLWVTTFDYTINQYSQLLTGNSLYHHALLWNPS